jgi:hypothetical protein
MPRSWCLVLAILLAARVATAATFTVKSTADSGAETLRAAITAANADGIPDDIAFEIPGAGVHTITLLTPLPTIRQRDCLPAADGWLEHRARSRHQRLPGGRHPDRYEGRQRRRR